mgnify:CR=1 FL=1
MKYIHIHPLDNVAVALEDLKKRAAEIAEDAAGLDERAFAALADQFRKQLRWKEHPNPPRQQCPLRAFFFARTLRGDTRLH